MKKTGFNGYIYNFSADYNAIAVSDTLDIHKYLLKKNEIVQKCSNLLSKYLFQQWYFWQSIKCKSIRMYFSKKSRM